MFGKLIKHEMRATGRIMLPLIIALPCLGLLSNLAVRLMDKSSGLVNTLCVIVLMHGIMMCFVLPILGWVNFFMVRFWRPSFLIVGSMDSFVY